MEEIKIINNQAFKSSNNILFTCDCDYSCGDCGDSGITWADSFKD